MMDYFKFYLQLPFGTMLSCRLPLIGKQAAQFRLRVACQQLSNGNCN